MPVPQIDFSPLGDLGKVYDELKRRARREAILSSIPPDASTQSLGALGLQLMRAGDQEGGIALARLGDAASRDARDFDWRRQEAQRAQGNTERLLALRERLAGAIPVGAVRALNAAPARRDEFNAKYGDDAADLYLGAP